MNVVILAGVFVTLLTGIPVFLQMRKHPRGLFILFFAEMWERFSYYGMRGLLIFYLTQHFLFRDDAASGIYGSYTSLVYLLPLVGGILADRFIGTRKAIAFGALLLVAGHGLMAYEGRPAQQFLQYGGAEYAFQTEGRGDARVAQIVVNGVAYPYEAAEGGGIELQGLPAGSPIPAVLPAGTFETRADQDEVGRSVFFLALSLIIMGVGFLKPNISTIVGQLYPQGDPRRDPGFTLYYYGINLGAFWAAVLCGYLGQTVGWWAGFGLAGIGMALGFVVFVTGKRHLEGHGEPPNPEALRRPVAGPLNREWLIYLGAIAGVGLVWLLVQRNAWVGSLLTFGTLASLAFLTWFLAFKCEKVQRERMMLALVLIAGAVVFFTLFEQAGTSLNLFADRNVQLPSDGFFTVTAAQTQSFNAGFILIFAPVFASMWVSLGRRGRDPNPLIKFGLGLAQVGLGFLLVVWAARAGFVDENFRLPLVFLALLYLFHTTGELFLSPVGLSEITKLSAPSIVSFLMAVWFLSSSIAQYVGGWIAGLAGTETVGGQVLDPGAALESSLRVFNMLGWGGIAAGAVFFVLSPLLKHWAHGVHDPRVARDAPEPLAPTVDGERQSVSPAVVRGEQGA